jgi:hypothetical protein
MPILRYKNRVARKDVGLLELGRCYKGAARTSADQKAPPPDLTYFRFEANRLPTITRETIAAAFTKLYGEQPDVIRNVQLPDDRLDVAFDAWREEWGKSRNGAPLLNKRCDGETLIYERTKAKDPRTGDVKEVVYREPVACPGNCQCKPVGRLRIFLPDLCHALGVLGTLTLITHAGTDIDNITATLNFVRQRAGRLQNVAFVLFRETVQLMSPAGFPVQKSVVRFELDTISAQAVALAAGEALALPPVSSTTALGFPVEAARVPRHTAIQAEEYPQYFDENGDDLPGVFGTVDAPVIKELGTAISIEIKTGAKGRSYYLRLDGGATVGPLYGFDAIRALSDEWSAQADLWKEYEPGRYDIRPLRVGTVDGKYMFEAVNP